jgi:heme A synthase
VEQVVTSSQKSPSAPHVTLHGRAFRWSVIWTLGLLLLGSVVHATESSLACPDWPTCFGTMVPEMSGGIFWEHLHRLVAGGLVLLWSAGTWFAFREPGTRRAVRVGAVVGLGLLIVQSLFGGLTVIMKLPDAVSTTHLALAFAFLSLATVLAVWSQPEAPNRPAEGTLPVATVVAAALVFFQSVVGAAVRHTDSGLACPDIPLCLGEWIPPLDQWPIGLHFAHRALAIVVSVLVVAIALRAVARGAGPVLYLVAAALVIAQVVLGFLSVASFLAVWAVSLHTLVAATLLATLVGAATLEASRPGVLHRR